MATTDMNAQIHIKDGNGNVNNIFPATKIANVEGLTAALNAKADTTTVNNQLSGKVDKETGKGLSTNDYTSAEKNKLSGIEAQANKTIVDSALSSSSENPVQNKVINTALGNKADASTVSSLSSQVSTNTTNIATQTSRIDNIVALPSGSTQGDAELMDIRIEANGKTASSAGAAVREQINDLKNDLQDYRIYKNLTIEVVSGKVATGSAGNPVQFPDTPSWRYCKAEVKGNVPISYNIVGNVNYMIVTDANDNVICGMNECKLNTAGNVFRFPANAKYTYMSSSGSFSNAVCMETSDDITDLLTYNTTNFPFNTTKGVVIKNLMTSDFDMVDDLPTKDYLSNNYYNNSTGAIANKYNIATSVIRGKFVSDLNGVVSIYDNADYGYAVIPVVEKVISSNCNLASPNFGFACQGNQIISNLYDCMVAKGDGSYVYNLPNGCDTVYACQNGWGNASDIVIVYGDYNITNYSELDYPIDSLVFVDIPKLRKGDKTHYSVGTGKEFETILDAALFAKAHPNEGIVFHVYGGTYDLIEEFEDKYGSDYFDNMVSGEYGIPIGFGEVWNFAPNAIVKAIYTGDNQAVVTSFCAFFCAQGGGVYDFELNGLNIECENIKYCVHDEMENAIAPYTHRYFNCQMKMSQNNISKFDSSVSWAATRCIGGGLGTCGDVTIDGCIFESNPETSDYYGAVSYHNGGLADCKSVVRMSNCYVYGNQGVTLQANSAVTSQFMSYFICCNNSFGRDVTPKTAVNMIRFLNFNNTIRS